MGFQYCHTYNFSGETKILNIGLYLDGFKNFKKKKKKAREL